MDCEGVDNFFENRYVMNLENTSLSGENQEQFLWSEYYQAFPAFSAETVRPGCHPRKMLHPSGAAQAIVLVHGLTDSPYYMSAIGQYFYESLGYDVYLPLLQCHGLKSPMGMTGVALSQWLENVGFAVRSAAQGAKRISIGGLSMGGAFGYYLACVDPMINGDLFLFSAALGLSDGPCGIPSWFKEWLLRWQCIAGLDRFYPLVGKYPYRYDRISLNSAVELAKLMRKNEQLSPPVGDADDLTRRIFAAWSECDKVISLDKLNGLRRRISGDRFVPFIIPATDQVEHASVVLQHPIHAPAGKTGAAPLEQANPRFAEMMSAINRFVEAG